MNAPATIGDVVAILALTPVAVGLACLAIGGLGFHFGWWE